MRRQICWNDCWSFVKNPDNGGHAEAVLTIPNVHLNARGTLNCQNPARKSSRQF